MNRNIYHTSCNILQYRKDRKVREPRKYNNEMILLEKFEKKRMEKVAAIYEIIK
jgi:hypothetical protein